MKILDPGHLYVVQTLDGDANDVFRLRFVKRIGDKFPGNVGPGYPGTTVQEVLRCVVDRLAYVDRQEMDSRTYLARQHAMTAITLLEARAAERHGRSAPLPIEAVFGPTCKKCGHVGCEGKCHP